MEDQYTTEYEKLEEKYLPLVQTISTLEDLITLGVEFNAEKTILNIKYDKWYATMGYDHEAIYYTSEFLIENCPQEILAYLPAARNQNITQQLADKIFYEIDKYKRLHIHIIEPHPDDALGSASGLCFSDGVFVHLWTVVDPHDERSNVSLIHSEIHKSIRKSPNIIEHNHLDFNDFHWNKRSNNLERDKCLEEYKKEYSEFLEALKKKIGTVVSIARKGASYIAIPLGIEHPMHMLVSDIVLDICISEEFPASKIIFYIDHPYDYLNAGYNYDEVDMQNRTLDAFNYASNKIREMEKANSLEKDNTHSKEPLVRCDDVSFDQAMVEALISDIYGEKHLYEFAGSLRQTMCSYLVKREAYEELKKRNINLHINNILFVTSQAKPFYKTGGLGEVAYTYCNLLREYVNDVRIIMPKYSDVVYQDIGKTIEKTPFAYITHNPIKGKKEEIHGYVETIVYQGLRYYLVDIPNYFSINGLDSINQGDTFALFSDALLQHVIETIKYFPSVIHCNDWQTALIPMLMKTKYTRFYKTIKSVYTIHFYGYQGIYSKNRILRRLGLDKEHCALCISCSEGCYFYNIDMLDNRDIEKLSATPSQMSFMKAGIKFADFVTTVSHGYAKEMSSYQYAKGVTINGIRNGITLKNYYLPDRDNFLKYKSESKLSLQKELNLQESEKLPLICMVSRLVPIKGVDVVKVIVPYLSNLGIQLVIVGDDATSAFNDRPYGDFFTKAEKSSNGMVAYRRFNEDLEYRTYAGSDMLLMPSLTEACGTTQMLAMAYGVVPIVSMISAFDDTVIDFKERDKKRMPENWGKGIGFYAYKDDPWVLLEVLKKATEIYTNEKSIWNKVAIDCFKVDFGWRNNSIIKYLKIYNNTVKS